MKVVVVCGPTASGKTRLAADIAEKHDGEVVSADSMQIYKGMDIATAAPTEEEMHGVVHHLIGFFQPTESFSVADYVLLAREAIADIHSRGKLPVICGGTGLYIDSLVENIVFDDTAQDMEYRETLRALAEKEGNGVLLEMLREIDPQSAERLHENNRSRIIRALEVYKISGKTMTRLREESRAVPSEYDACFIGLNYSDREQLYERINLRVDRMIENGLLEEARGYYSQGECPTSSQAIGYKELKPYLDGQKSLDECVEHLKQETRRYAKRQLTWFRRNKAVNWINIEKNMQYDEILKISENLLKNMVIS